ncbi:MAG: type IV pili methyl-accepting chemotaxis transducer N-terminal domain-containing protein, partial [Burkholderiaceae bacterium]
SLRLHRGLRRSEVPHRCRLLPGLPGKCRTTIVAVTFFLVFDLGVLVLNFYPSLRIAEDAVMIKLSGRQRVLSQRTAKNVFQVEKAVRSGQDPKPSLDEWREAVQLFDTTRAAFRPSPLPTSNSPRPCKN